MHYQRVRNAIPINGNPPKPMRLCGVDGCGRKHRANGMCELHNQRARDGRPLDGKRPPKLCEVSGCRRKYCAKGMCGMHYQRVKYGIPIDGKPPRLCEVEGCNRKHRAFGLCGMHYKQTPEVNAKSKAYQTSERVRAMRRASEQKPHRKAQKKNYFEKYYKKPEGKARMRAFYQTPEAKAKGKAYQQTEQGKAVHRKALKEYAKTPGAKIVAMRYARTPKGKFTSRRRTHIRRTRLAGGGGSYTLEEENALREAFNQVCPVCSKTFIRKLEMEHIFPIVFGGSSNITNYMLMCRSCNARKGARYLNYISDYALKKMIYDGMLP